MTWGALQRIASKGLQSSLFAPQPLPGGPGLGSEAKRGNLWVSSRTGAPKEKGPYSPACRGHQSLANIPKMRSTLPGTLPPPRRPCLPGLLPCSQALPALGAGWRPGAPPKPLLPGSLSCSPLLPQPCLTGAQVPLGLGHLISSSPGSLQPRLVRPVGQATWAPCPDTEAEGCWVLKDSSCRRPQAEAARRARGRGGREGELDRPPALTHPLPLSTCQIPLTAAPGSPRPQGV